MRLASRAPIGVLVFSVALALGVSAEQEVASSSTASVEIERFFEPAYVADVRVGPSGSFFTIARQTSDSVVLEAVHRKTETPTRVSAVRGAGLLDYRWIEDDWLAVETVQASGEHDMSLVRLDWDEEEKRVVPHSYSIPGSPDVVHTLPREPGKILLGDRHAVALVDLAQVEKQGGASALIRSPRVASLRDPVVSWVVDRNGAVRAAIAVEIERSDEDEQVFLRVHHRESADGPWRSGHRQYIDDEVGFAAFGFTEDGKRLLVATNRDRDRYALVEFDPEAKKEVATVYEHPDAEIEDIVFDADYETMIGVELYREGAIEYDYFSDAFTEHEKELSAAIPDRTLRVTSVSRDRAILGVVAFSPRHPARYWVVDTEARSALDIGPRSPGLEGVALAPRARFTTRAEGGPEIEAFFTVGANAPGKPALIVLPHGGPIGPRTSDGLDPVVQLLANRGYAVLEVNYRGSGGLGRAFERAGRRQWGKGIEDDIDAAVEYVLERGWVDETRMAVVGGSYGGYSALMSAIRHPTRFRCVATLFGVTDLPLLFDQPATQNSRWVRERRIEIMGDPETDLEDMLAHSPVYRAAEFQVPILIAQGGSDRNVDVEHAYRLRLMLEKHGKEFEWLVMREKGHDLAPEPDTIRMMEKLTAFLARHLGPNGPPAGAVARAN